MIGQLNIRHLPTTPSTMEDARAWAENGAPHLATVVADDQTSGRGRLNRPWTMFAHHSLACTVIVRGAYPHLPFLTALAMARALREFMGLCEGGQGGEAPLDAERVMPAQAGIHGSKQAEGLPYLTLKWPNDLLLNGKKLAGILVESLPLIPPNPPTYLVGVGLNITRPPEVPDTFQGIFLSETVAPPTRDELLYAFIPCFSDILALYTQSGWPALAGEYVRQSCTIGQNVRWENPNGTVLFGRAQGLTPDGTLVVVDDAGGLHHIHSGDVIAQGRKH
ncbi:MAG: biotin--[acetyl-CoA-carboxylase] ligase [Alphaproteobacteria bacterium]